MKRFNSFPNIFRHRKTAARSLGRHIFILSMTLTLAGCISTDKPLLKIGASDHYPELVGLYTTLEPAEAREMGFVEEDSHYYRIGYSPEYKSYTCVSGQTFLSFDAQKIAENLYLFQMAPQVPLPADPSQKTYFVLFRRSEDGQLNRVMPSPEATGVLLDKQGIDYVLEGTENYTLKNIGPQDLHALIHGGSTLQLANIDETYHKLKNFPGFEPVEQKK